MMALVQHLRTFRTDLARQLDQLAADLNLFLAAQGRLIIWDVAWSRLESTSDAGIVQFRVLYSELTGDSIGLEYQVALYEDGATSAQEQFNAVFRAGANLVPQHVVDLTRHTPRRVGSQKLLVIFAKTDSTPAGLVGHPSATFVAEPSGDIAAGAAGDCTIYDARGEELSTATPVTNRGAAVWSAGERALCAYDLDAGVLLGQPTCVGAVALTTTTSTAPTTDSPCMSFEVQSSDPVMS